MFMKKILFLYREQMLILLYFYSSGEADQGIGLHVWMDQLSELHDFLAH